MRLILTVLGLMLVLNGCHLFKKSEGAEPPDIEVTEADGSITRRVEVVQLTLTQDGTTDSLGNLYIYLYDQTPKHKANFLKLVREGFYDSTAFHRVVDNFMIQGGDPNSKNDNPADDGTGGPGYQINAEINPFLNHTYGAVAAARKPNPDKKSSGSQFYIVENRRGTPHLNGDYTVFGKVIKGMKLVEQIASMPKRGSKLNTTVRMRASIVTMKLDEVISSLHPKPTQP